MAKIKTVFVDIQESDKKYLSERQPENTEFVFLKEKLDEAVKKHFDEIKDAEILSVFTSSGVPGELLAKFENLKLIAARSTGFNNVDLEFCSKYNISVVNVPAYGERTVAEYAFALLLNVIRKVNTAYNDLKSGHINLEKYRGNDLFGKTIGLIGTGSIGCYAAKIAYGFGMNILTYDPFPKEFLEKNLGAKYVDLDELYSKSDIISIHAPSRKENFHMINDAAFAKMKDGVIIINTARGEIMNTNALYKALISGKVAGAGLDVLECEEIIRNESLFLTKIDCVQKECLEKTLINHELLEMPNVIVTPHTAFDTVEAVERILQITIDNIKAYISGNIINRVN